MYELDHVAIEAQDIPATAQHYIDHYGATVLYQDQTWAFLRVGQGKLALVTPGQHPPHVAFRVDYPTLESAAARAGKKIDQHRDGTQGIYVDDPGGNVVELICYPAGGTIYERK